MGKTEEEIKKEKRRKYFNEYMKSCDWYCDVCDNGKKLYFKRKRNAFENKETFSKL